MINEIDITKKADVSDKFARVDESEENERIKEFEKFNRFEHEDEF